MSDRFARTISIALVPPLPAAAAFGVLALRHSSMDPWRDTLLWFIGALFAGGLQIAYVLHLRARSRVSAYDVPDRRQRTQPYLVSAGLSAVGLLLFAAVGAPLAHRLLMWCFMANTLILAIINLWWKISAHLMGLTGPAAFLLPLPGWVLLTVGMLVAVLAWSRVHLHAHTLAQVLTGALAGIILVLLQLSLISSYGWVLPALFR